MKQLFSFFVAPGGSTSGHVGTLLAGAPSIDVPMGTNTRGSVVPYDCTFRHLTITLVTPPGVGHSRSFIVNVNHVDTPVVLTFTDLETSQRWTGADLAFLAGDVVCLKTTFTAGAAGDVTRMGIQFEIEGPERKNQYHKSHFGANFFFTNTIGAFSNNNNDDIAPLSGTFTKLIARGVTSAGAVDVTIVLRKNGVIQDGSAGTVDTRIHITTDGSSGFVYSSTFALPVVPTDRIGIVAIAPTGVDTTATLEFVPDIDGQSVIATAPAVTAPGGTEYTSPADVDSLGYGSDISFGRIAGGVTPASYGHFYAALSAAPGSGKSRTFTYQKNGVDTAVQNVFADSSVLASDTLHSFTVADGETFQIKSVTSGAATSGVLIAAITQFVAPPSGTLIVQKVTDPPASVQGFDFTTLGLTPSAFTLLDGQAQQFDGVPVGTYSVSETLPADWVQTSVVVSNGDDPSAITIADGETVTVTYTNTFTPDLPTGNLTVRKVTLPPESGQPFTIRTPGLTPATFPLTDGQSQAFVGIPAGTYNVSEVVPTGWVQAAVTVSNGSPPEAVTVGEDESVEVIFTNAPAPEPTPGVSACPAPGPTAVTPAGGCPAPNPDSTA